MFLCVFGALDLAILVNLLRLLIKVPFKKKKRKERGGENNMEGRRSRGRGSKRAQESREERETTAQQRQGPRVPLVLRNLL